LINCGTLAAARLRGTHLLQPRLPIIAARVVVEDGDPESTPAIASLAPQPKSQTRLMQAYNPQAKLRTYQKLRRLAEFLVKYPSLLEGVNRAYSATAGNRLHDQTTTTHRRIRARKRAAKKRPTIRE
jgi:hypothetical protein